MAYQRHAIEEIEGIGRIRSGKMRELGIFATEDLLLYTEGYLRSLLSKVDYFPVARIPEFRAHALLMQIDGIDGQFAEALYKSRRRGFEKLSYPDPTVVVRQLDTAAEEGMIRESAGVAQVARWQKRGLIIHYTGTCTGVVEWEGTPVSGATVFLDKESAVTDQQGKFWLPAAPYGSHLLIIRSEGFQRFEIPVNVTPDAIPVYHFELIPGEDFEQLSDEACGEPLLAFRPDDKLDFYDCELDELPAGTPLQFRHRYRNGNVRLIGVFRRRRGRYIEIPRVVVPAAMIADDALKADVYIWENGQLTPSDVSLTEWRKHLIFGEPGVERVITDWPSVADLILK